jgi:hypothetical protein
LPLGLPPPGVVLPARRRARQRVAGAAQRGELEREVAVAQLASLGIAGIGTLFFGLLGADADRTTDFLHAAERTTLAVVALIAAAFALAFLLPARPREQGAPASSVEAAPA